MSAIGMLDLRAEYAELRGAIDQAVQRVLTSGHFILGPEGAALESELAALTGAAHAVAVASGTDALHLALRAAGIGPGDDVVLPAFTFIATAEAVSYTGARPVFADIDPASFNVTAATLQAALTPATRAVIVVHLYGQCAEMPAIAALCEARGMTLIEDCAQAIGADFDGRAAGAWGAFGCFSFYPTKNLGAYGDAGLVTVHDVGDAERVRMLRHHGSRQTYQHEFVGYNSRLDELQAAILRAKLPHLLRFNDARRRAAARYRAGLEGTSVALPAEHGRGRHVYHQFTIRSDRRDTLRKALGDAGIASAVYYPLPVHRQPAYAASVGALDLPASDAAAASVLSLPIHPYLRDADVDRVCAVLRSARP
ncbi:MAG TPA: DegT/DnrJ/EryC1/StrS family aminotransferase [Burkholderiales bacterium]|nr:DegT/DnrJ/EryC1/StrS family aminotransferase [Burkholderiales bacterium]